MMESQKSIVFLLLVVCLVTAFAGDSSATCNKEVSALATSCSMDYILNIKPSLRCCQAIKATPDECCSLLTQEYVKYVNPAKLKAMADKCGREMPETCGAVSFPGRA